MKTSSNGKGLQGFKGGNEIMSLMYSKSNLKGEASSVRGAPGLSPRLRLVAPSGRGLPCGAKGQDFPLSIDPISTLRRTK